MILYSNALEDNLHSKINKYKLHFEGPYCRFAMEEKIEVGHHRKVRSRRYMEVCSALSFRFNYQGHHKSSGPATEAFGCSEFRRATQVQEGLSMELFKDRKNQG